jgi:hypothetical protein
MRYLLVVVATTAWAQQPKSQPAEEAYKNIQILKGMPAERVPMVMGVFNRVLGVQCTHCHVEEAMDNGDKPAFAKTRVMFKMRNWIAQTEKVNATCWTCHRGNTKPPGAPPDVKNQWPADLKLTTEQESMPASQVYKNLKFFSGNAGQLQSSMNFMAASLGVGCGHCHVEGAWEKDDKPAKDSARKMLAMVRDIRQEYGSIGRIGCFTCHHGGVKPETNPPPA